MSNDLPRCRCRRGWRAAGLHVRSGRQCGRGRRGDVRLGRYSSPVVGNGNPIAPELVAPAGVVDDGGCGRREHHHATPGPPPHVVRGPEAGAMLESPAPLPVEVPIFATHDRAMVDVGTLVTPYRPVSIVSPLGLGAGREG